MTQYFIGTKQIEAWEESNGEALPGYAVKYKDGYTSWSPKDVFERAYIPMGVHNDGNKITKEMIDNFVLKKLVLSLGNKTTVVVATLGNGYEITESSSCSDPSLYDEAIGEKLATDKIKARVFDLLSFLLQTARYGLDENPLIK